MFALALSLALLAPADASESPVSETAQADDDSLDRVLALYERGSAYYATAEYALAVEAFQEAYFLAGEIDDDERVFSARRNLLFNLARSQYRAYGNDRDVVRLRKAKSQIALYLDAVADGDPDRADGLALQSKIDEALTAAEGKTPEPASSGPGSVEAPAREAASPDSPSASPGGSPPANPRPSQPERDTAAGRPLMFSGIAVLVLGVGAGGLAGAGAGMASSASKAWDAGPTTVERDAARSDGKRANTLIIAGSIGAGVLVTTGAVLMALGAKKKTSSTGRVSVVPWAGKNYGVSLTGSF